MKPPQESPTNTAIDRLMKRCEGAYSDITLRGYRNDLQVFKGWCERKQEVWLPASPATVALFIDEQAPPLAIATLKRRITAIQFAHRMADLPSPIGHSKVLLAFRRASRAKSRRPNQALGLTSDLLREILAACPKSLSGFRDAAMISVGYDTLCRSSELVAMRVEDLIGDCSSIRIPRSKSDQLGDGRIGYLSPQTIEWLNGWLAAAKLSSGPLFRGLHTNRVSPEALDTSSIRRRVKLLAKRANLGDEVVKGLSGHSMRVGAAQDMMVSGFDSLGIMQAGGWRTFAVLARYVENSSAARMHVRRWERILRTQ